MPDRTLSIDGVRVPRLLYGTAWKEDQTRALTELALRQGFRGIDTANQRRHYHEAAVGEAITASIQSGLVTRDDLFLQTKFTFPRGQDHRLPYDPKAPIPLQVEQSFASSLGTWESTRSTRTYCTGRPSGPDWPRPTGPRGVRWKPSTTAAGRPAGSKQRHTGTASDSLC